MSDSLDRVLARPDRPFAILHRPHTTGSGQLEVLTGEVSTVAALADIEVGDPSSAGPRTFALIPHRQVAERGLECVDDGAPLIVLRVDEHAVLPKTSALERLPETPISLSGTRFDVDDSTYAELVRRVVAEEIGAGEGANFVIRRSFLAEIEDYEQSQAFTFFRRLCEQEAGAYWTFLVHTGDRTFVGATPERHVSVDDGLVTMNPIS
ncbi:anthranilate synthase, partial [Lentzea aerocolonigenes]